MQKLMKLKNRVKELEIEYRRVEEKQKLLTKIKKSTGQTICDSYTLREIGKILNISHESVRHIENKAQRLLKHPSVSRKLREYTKD